MQFGRTVRLPIVAGRAFVHRVYSDTRTEAWDRTRKKNSNDMQQAVSQPSQPSQHTSVNPSPDGQPRLACRYLA